MAVPQLMQNGFAFTFKTVADAAATVNGLLTETRATTCNNNFNIGQVALATKKYTPEGGIKALADMVGCSASFLHECARVFDNYTVRSINSLDRRMSGRLTWKDLTALANTKETRDREAFIKEALETGRSIYECKYGKSVTVRDPQKYIAGTLYSMNHGQALGTVRKFKKLCVSQADWDKAEAMADLLMAGVAKHSKKTGFKVTPKGYISTALASIPLHASTKGFRAKRRP